MDESVGLAISFSWAEALKSDCRSEHYLRWEATLNQLSGMRRLCVYLNMTRDDVDFLWSIALYHQLNMKGL